MASAFIGQIHVFAFAFPPRNWARCDGQLLPINQNQALFSLLGTTYGGNGQTTFALPDLRGRSPFHWGTGPGLPTVSLGQNGGQENVTLTSAQIPAHVHTVSAANAAPNQGVPTGNNWAQGAYSATANAAMNGPALGNAGSSQPHSNLQPYLTVNFCIALFGIFPSRN